MRIVFADELDVDIYDIKIKTDALNKLNTGVYGKTIGVLNDLDFSVSDNKPIFEIVCINSELLQFKIDKIR